MDIQGQVAIVTGGASWLGEAVAIELARQGARVAVLDVDADGAPRAGAAVGGIGCGCDITDSVAVSAALDAAEAAFGSASRIVMNIAGIGGARRVIARDGRPAPLEDFERVVRINLIGTYNATRHAVARIARLAPPDDGERGVVVCTASAAAFDGQVGQEAYAASKGGIVSKTLPPARDLAQWGVRVVTIAPELFLTPLMHLLPPEVQQSLAASLPFPKRLGKPEVVRFPGCACRDRHALERRSHPPRRRLAHGGEMSPRARCRSSQRRRRCLLGRPSPRRRTWSRGLLPPSTIPSANGSAKPFPWREAWSPFYL